MTTRIKRKISSLDKILGDFKYKYFITDKKYLKLIKEKNNLKKIKGGGVGNANGTKNIKKNVNNKGTSMCQLETEIKKIKTIMEKIGSIKFQNIGTPIGNLSIEDLLVEIAKIPSINKNKKSNTYNKNDMVRMSERYRSLLQYVLVFIAYLRNSNEITLLLKNIVTSQQQELKTIKNTVNSLKSTKTTNEKIVNIQKSLKQMSTSVATFINKKQPPATQLKSAVNKLINGIGSIKPSTPSTPS